MNPLDNLLSKLEKVRHIGSHRYAARCPAHNDKSPSLSIRQAEDGTILLYCFTGCSFEDVLDAIGLTFSDLYPGRWKAAYKAASANGGKRFRRRLPEIDLHTEDLMVLRIAEQKLVQSKTLSIEDKARVALAMERVGKESAA